MPKYNHMIVTAFTVESSHPDGDDLTKEQLVAGMISRGARILTNPNEGSTFEIFDVHDSYEIEEEKPNAF